MNKKKKLTIILSITIPLTIIIIGVLIYFSILASYRNLPPLKDKSYQYKNVEFNTSIGEKKDKFDAAELKITKITKEDYNDASLVNVFYDYSYDVYYKVDIKLTKDNNNYDARVFCVHSRNISHFYKQRYSFDLKIDGKIYQSALFIHNYGLSKPLIRLGVWGEIYENN